MASCKGMVKPLLQQMQRVKCKIITFFAQVHNKRYVLTAAKFAAWINQYAEDTSPQVTTQGTPPVTVTVPAATLPQVTPSQATTPEVASLPDRPPQATATPGAPQQATSAQGTPQSITIPYKITERTALRYMRQLGFKFKTYRQGLQYTDGHERPDVIEYRKKYLNMIKALEVTHEPPPLCEDGVPSWHSGKDTAAKKVVFIYHDETIFHANDAPSRGWHDDQGSRELRPKGKGRGIMYSDFVEEYNGFLRLTDEEYEKAREIDQRFPRAAHQKFEYGKAHQGYWNARTMMRNLKDAVRIAELKYPR